MAKRIFRNNKKLTVLLRTIKNINNTHYIDKVYDISTLNIHLGNIRQEKGIYYNIEIKNDSSGFFAHIYWVMNGLFVADRLGLIPYVSIKGSRYNNPDDPEDNMYEHYYIQSNKIKQGASYINYELSLSNYIWDEFKMDGYIVSEEYIDAMAEILNKYMPVKSNVLDKIHSETKTVIKDPSHTLAVHARGTAYSVGFYGHPVQVGLQDYQKYVNEALDNGFTTIFLATDDNAIRDQFREAYGDRIIMFEDVLRSSNTLDVIDLEDGRENNAFLLGYEVLRDAIAMAYCDGFVAGLSKVSMYTRIQRKANGNDFTYKQIIDKGIVVKKRRFSELKYKMRKKAYDKSTINNRS